MRDSLGRCQLVSRLAATFLVTTITLSSVRSLCAQEDESRVILPVFGLNVLNTTVVALDAGITYRPFGPQHPFWAPVASAEAGVAGGQLSFGIGYYRPPRTDWGGPGSELSLRVQASALRTWGNPFHVGPHESFVGIELQGMFTIVGLRLGYFRRVPKAPDGGDSFLSAGLIIGWQ